MSEIDKHYGGDAEDLARPQERARKSATGEERDEQSVADRAEEAVTGVREGVTRAADRVREAVSERYDRAQDWASEGYESVSRNAVYARRRSIAELNRGRRSVAAFVDENPIMIGVAGLAAGLLIGSLLPRTRREDELLGRYADDLRREGARYARDVAHQGREAISENLRAIVQPSEPKGN